mmetsp:Transcript_10680/g.43784  ORF Transcript_10680/g.43784 Transcript_10680/m.43784 type:complete len:462 (-) Transcript_10680:64-1449(-)
MGVAFQTANFGAFPCDPNGPTTPTPTPTPTPTQSRTTTPSFTPTPTASPTESPIPSPTPTTSPTASSSVSMSATGSVTASDSVTPSPGSTASATGSITTSPSFTSTQTASVSPTPAETVSPSRTPPETVSPTRTPPETVSPTRTPPETVTPTATPSETPTNSATRSVTPSKNGISETPTTTASTFPTALPTRTPADAGRPATPTPASGPAPQSFTPTASPTPSLTPTATASPEEEGERCVQPPGFSVREQVVELSGEKQLITIFSEDSTSLGDVLIPPGYSGSIKVEQGFVTRHCQRILAPLVNLTMITTEGEELETYSFQNQVKICLETRVITDPDDTCMAFYNSTRYWECVPRKVWLDERSRFCSATTHFTTFSVLLESQDGGGSSSDDGVEYDNIYTWLTVAAVAVALIVVLIAVIAYEIKFRRKRAMLNKSLSVHGTNASLIANQASSSSAASTGSP